MCQSYWNIGVAVVTVLHQDLVNLLARLLNVGSVVQVPHIWKRIFMKWSILEPFHCSSNLHSITGWTWGRHSPPGRGSVASWWPSPPGTSPPCWALPTGPGSAARTSDRWAAESRPGGCCASCNVSLVSGARSGGGGIISHLWWMWSSINISDQESCSSFIWSSTCSTRKKKLF